jgi:CRISPR-associated protein Cas1
MPGRIVEISNDGKHLQSYRGFMQVLDKEKDSNELARIPLDDIDAVIGNSHGLSYTNNLLVALAERGVPFVLCGTNHNVVGMLLALDGNHQQSLRMDAQIGAGMPLKKQIWASIVKNKLTAQSAVLKRLGIVDSPLTSLVKRVRSGDPGNIEAQGARRYWTLLFGDTFRRDRDSEGVNAMLNYGYTVLRATTARAIVAAGLHPSLGIHHRDGSNPLRLADDLMEPFRPAVDLCVHQLLKSGLEVVTPDVKRALVGLMYADLATDLGRTPLSVCVQRLATSLAQTYVEGTIKLSMPHSILPLALEPSPVA